MKYRLGTRKSDLALKQAREVQQLLIQRGCDVELVLIESDGDQNLKQPIYEIQVETPGIFTKKLEQALLEKRIDLAVHSLKDLPTSQPAGLQVAAITKRETPHDMLIIAPERFDPQQPFGLSPGAKLGTSSLRRQAQFASVRPDLEFVGLRGNVPRRLTAVKTLQVDAVVLAAAGLHRLGIDLADFKTQTLPLDPFVPAPGQGALAIEVTLECPQKLFTAIQSLNDTPTEISTRIERHILKELEGGCTLPLGVHCQKVDNNMKVLSFLGIQQLGSQKPIWRDFQSFDILGLVEQTLVSKTVEYFRSRANANK